jgi:hypothetical protein
MSELDHLIQPEIVNDEFYDLIKRLAQTLNVRHILEIGSSAGGGSTQAFVEGISQNPSRPTLYCMEVSETRFAALKERYAPFPFVKCYNVSSIPVQSFASRESVADFYRTNKTKLNAYPLEQVLGWLQQDIDYVQGHKVPQEGIKLIKAENRIDYFGLVLIDGSGFTGEAELNEVYGADVILLDDVDDIKNYKNYEKLRGGLEYELYAENWKLRNGYAAFKLRAEAYSRVGRLR